MRYKDCLDCKLVSFEGHVYKIIYRDRGLVFIDSPFRKSLSVDPGQLQEADLPYKLLDVVKVRSNNKRGQINRIALEEQGICYFLDPEPSWVYYKAEELCLLTPQFTETRKSSSVQYGFKVGDKVRSILTGDIGIVTETEPLRVKAKFLDIIENMYVRELYWEIISQQEETQAMNLSSVDTEKKHYIVFDLPTCIGQSFQNLKDAHEYIKRTLKRSPQSKHIIYESIQQVELPDPNIKITSY